MVRYYPSGTILQGLNESALAKFMPNAFGIFIQAFLDVYQSNDYLYETDLQIYIIRQKPVLNPAIGLINWLKYDCIFNWDSYWGLMRIKPITRYKVLLKY